MGSGSSKRSPRTSPPLSQQSSCSSDKLGDCEKRHRTANSVARLSIVEIVQSIETIRHAPLVGADISTDAIVSAFLKGTGSGGDSKKLRSPSEYTSTIITPREAGVSTLLAGMTFGGKLVVAGNVKFKHPDMQIQFDEDTGPRDLVVGVDMLTLDSTTMATSGVPRIGVVHVYQASNPEAAPLDALAEFITEANALKLALSAYATVKMLKDVYHGDDGVCTLLSLTAIELMIVVYNGGGGGGGSGSGNNNYVAIAHLLGETDFWMERPCEGSVGGAHGLGAFVFQCSKQQQQGTTLGATAAEKTSQGHSLRHPAAPRSVVQFNDAIPM